MTKHIVRPVETDHAPMTLARRQHFMELMAQGELVDWSGAREYEPTTAELGDYIMSRNKRLVRETTINKILADNIVHEALLPVVTKLASNFVSQGMRPNPYGQGLIDMAKIFLDPPDYDRVIKAAQAYERFLEGRGK